MLSNWRIHGGNHAADGSALTQLIPEWIEKRLASGQRIMNYTVGFVESIGLPYDLSGFRPLLEYRLSLGILRDRREQVRQAAADLARAYRLVRGDYPFLRFVFWQFLARIPNSVAVRLLKLAYASNRALIARDKSPEASGAHVQDSRVSGA